MYVELQCTEYMLYITNIHCVQCLAPILHHPTLYYTIHSYTTLYSTILHLHVLRR